MKKEANGTNNSVTSTVNTNGTAKLMLRCRCCRRQLTASNEEHFSKSQLKIRRRHRNCRECVAARPLPGLHLLRQVIPLPDQLILVVAEYWGDWVLSGHIFERKMRKIISKTGYRTEAFEEARERLRRAVSGRDWVHDGVRDWYNIKIDDLSARYDDWTLESGRLWDIPIENQLGINRSFVRGDEFMDMMKLLYFLWDRFMGTDEGAAAAANDQALGLEHTPEAKMRSTLRTIVFTLDEFDSIPQEVFCRYGYYRPTRTLAAPAFTAAEPPDPDLLPSAPGSYFRNYQLLCAYPLLIRSRGAATVATMFERAASRYYNDAHEGIFFALYHWDYRSNPAAGLAMLRRMIVHWRTHNNIVLDCGGTGIYKDQERIGDVLRRAGVISEEEARHLWDGDT